MEKIEGGGIPERVKKTKSGGGGGGGMSERVKMTKCGGVAEKF